MHSGDMFAFAKGLPLIDTSNGGSGVDYPKSLAKAAAIKGVESVIPGHSPVQPLSELKEYSEFMAAVLAATEEAKKAGKTVDQAVADFKLPEKFKGYNLGRLKPAVTAIYSELK
jgi:hypothetical protein